MESELQGLLVFLLGDILLENNKVHNQNPCPTTLQSPRQQETPLPTGPKREEGRGRHTLRGTQLRPARSSADGRLTLGHR